jgi:hypothetical protein
MMVYGVSLLPDTSRRPHLSFHTSERKHMWYTGGNLVFFGYLLIHYGSKDYVERTF